MNEKQWQTNVIQLAKTYGWTVYHTLRSEGSEPGFPDLVLVHPKRGVLFRELKTDDGRMSSDQLRWLGVLTSAGCDADVWRPADLDRVNLELAPHRKFRTPSTVQELEALLPWAHIEDVRDGELVIWTGLRQRIDPETGAETDMLEWIDTEE